MATTIIKSAINDNQAYVDSTGHLFVTTGGTGTGIDTNLVSVAGTPISLGQTTMSFSFPVTIASDQSPIPVTGTIIATNPSVGFTGVTAPTSATEMGAVDAFGNLQPLLVDPAGKLLVDISGSATITGTVSANIVGLSTFQTSQYIVGTSAVQITPVPFPNRSSVGLRATTVAPTDIVYIGPNSGVTTTNGYPLYNGDTLQLDITTGEIWAISNAAGQIVSALEIA